MALTQNYIGVNIAARKAGVWFRIAASSAELDRGRPEMQ